MKPVGYNAHSHWQPSLGEYFSAEQEVFVSCAGKGFGDNSAGGNAVLNKIITHSLCLSAGLVGRSASADNADKLVVPLQFADGFVKPAPEHTPGPAVFQLTAEHQKSVFSPLSRVY